MRRPNRRPNYTKTEDITNWEIPPDYLIYKDGADTVAVNGSTGEEDSRNVDSVTVIQYTLEQLTTGGKVLIKPGEYIISKSLEMYYSNQWLQGCGKLTVLKTGNSMTDYHLIKVGETGGSTITGCVISDLSVDGNKANNATYGIGIQISSKGQFTHVRNCFIYNTRQYGVSAGGIRPHIIGNRFIGCEEAGIYFSSYDARIIGNQVRYNIQYGVLITGNGALVANNLINNNGLSQIRVRGILNVIQGNQLDYCDKCGIEMEGADENTITNNVGCRCEEHGVYCHNSDYNVISNNVFQENSQKTSNVYSGIALVGSSNHNIVTGNEVSDLLETHMQKWGVSEGGTADYNIISKNIAINNLTAEMNIIGANTLCDHNIGWKTENSGTATILNAGTAIVIAHGLDGTPTVINVTGQHAEVLDIYVDTIGAANFTITTIGGAVSADRAIFWEAKVR